MVITLTSKDLKIPNNLRTAVFVDYEAWFYGAKDQYGAHIKNGDIYEWFEDVKTKGNIAEVAFFADLSSEDMKKEAVKLRTITNNIIDCQKDERGKDYTDFILVTRIYETLIRDPNIEQLVLFSGDGHFQSVMAFWRNFQNKRVGVYAILGTLSTQLKNVANWYVEISYDHGGDKDITDLIFQQLRWVQTQENLVPTYKKTVEIISSRNPSIDKTRVSDALSSLIKGGYISQTLTSLPDGQPIRGLVIDWAKVEADFKNDK